MRCVHSVTLTGLTILASALVATASPAKTPAWMAPMLAENAALFSRSGAEPPSPPPQAGGPQALSDDELSGLRGGFITTNGFTFGFGVVIRSYIDDRLALQTQLTWTPTGPVTHQVQGDVPGVTDLASAMTSLLNSGIDLTGIKGASGGVALVDGNGATALIHNVTTNQLQSLIINNASYRNIRQDMELNLYLPDLAAIQANSITQQQVSQLTYDLNTSLVGSLGR